MCRARQAGVTGTGATPSPPNNKTHAQRKRREGCVGMGEDGDSKENIQGPQSNFLLGSGVRSGGGREDRPGGQRWNSTRTLGNPAWKEGLKDSTLNF